MANSHKQSITVTRAFYEAVETYRQQNSIKTWSQALVQLASIALQFEKPASPIWGGDRKSEAFIEFIKCLDKMSPAEAEAFLESMEV